MYEYDATLKSILQSLLAGSVTADWAGVRVARWLSAELPDVRVKHADMLGETADGELVHIELQSRNDPQMALRMAEYSLAIRRRFRRFPRQMVFYVGRARLRMTERIEAPGWSFRCRMMDIRQLDAESLLRSRLIGDNVLAILASQKDQVDAIRRILGRVAAAPVAERGSAVAALFVLAGLRDTGGIIRKEITTMPILDDIMDHDYLGPLLRKAIADGERRIVTKLLQERFGRIPVWAATRLEKMSSREIERVSVKLFKAENLKDLLA